MNSRQDKQCHKSPSKVAICLKWRYNLPALDKLKCGHFIECYLTKNIVFIKLYREQSDVCLEAEASLVVPIQAETNWKIIKGQSCVLCIVGKCQRAGSQPSFWVQIVSLLHSLSCIVPCCSITFPTSQRMPQKCPSIGSSRK